jgi:hypothetical protein
MRGFKTFPRLNMAGAGDVNADGYGDLLLGVEGGGRDLEGMTYLIYGGPALPAHLVIEEDPPVPDGVVRIRGEGAQEAAGKVGPAGDFDGDGYADFVIGAPGYQQDPSGQVPGNIFLMLGAKSLPDRIELKDLRGQGIKINSAKNELTLLGYSVGAHGDLNGDGRTDFAFTEQMLLSQSQFPDSVFALYGQGPDQRFIRGDANRDDAVDVSDATAILGYLFLGAGTPPCEDAEDVDDLGSVELTDVVNLLDHLFLGGPAPPAPYPGPGVDLTADGLGCRGS